MAERGAFCEKATGPDKTCTFKTGKIILQQEMSPEQVKKLLNEGKTDLLKGFVSKKTNRKFEAFLVVKDGGTAFEFAPREKKGKAGGKSAAPKEPLPKIDFTGKESLGQCPKCGGKVFDTERGYLCENSQRDTKPCKFAISKEILQQPIEREQMKKLLASGKTDLLTAFVSKKGRRFKAFLVKQPDGKIGFEFQARPAKEKAPAEKTTRPGSGRRARSTR